ncbi:hypothetical protein Bca52824_079797 [Brassica carinata]|uniref:AIG1-type G domain-containing protein n=1 Tax=Brassica carinata TaxID=52824 RepID=A0A8X7Q0A8_BRACI|nr:hypothetical protein Bca52824_079797 [Brassica carinata]
MGSNVREWVGFQQFPAATQEKLIEFFAKLKQKDMNSLTVVVMGKGGVGKSSTVNSLIGEQVVRVSPFQAEGLRPVMVSRTMGGFTINIIDTPGLVEAGYVNHQALELIKGFLVNRTIDVLLYVDRLDVYRVDELDKQVVQAITQTFGKEIWCKTLLVLTHAQFSPPDDLSYETFSSKRSDSLLKTIRAGSKMGKQQFEVLWLYNSITINLLLLRQRTSNRIKLITNTLHIAQLSSPYAHSFVVSEYSTNSSLPLETETEQALSPSVFGLRLYCSSVVTKVSRRVISKELEQGSYPCT